MWMKIETVGLEKAIIIFFLGEIGSCKIKEKIRVKKEFMYTDPSSEKAREN